MSGYIDATKSAYPISVGPFDGLKVTLTSADVVDQLNHRIDKLTEELNNAKAKVAIKERFVKELNEAPDVDAPNITLSNLARNDQSVIDNHPQLIKLLTFLRDHTSPNRIFVVSWDDFTSSLIDPRH